MLRRAALIAFFGIALLGWAAGLAFLVGGGMWVVVMMAWLAWHAPAGMSVWMPVGVAAFFAIAVAGVGPFWLKFGRALWWQISDVVAGRKATPADWWAASYHPFMAHRGEVAPPRQPVAPRFSPPKARYAVQGARRLSRALLVSSFVVYALAVALSALLGPDTGWWVSAVAWGLAGFAAVLATAPWAWKLAPAKDRVRVWLYTGFVGAALGWCLPSRSSWQSAALVLLMWALLLLTRRRRSHRPWP